MRTGSCSRATHTLAFLKIYLRPRLTLSWGHPARRVCHQQTARHLWFLPRPARERTEGRGDTMASSEASKEPPKSTKADKGYLASAVDSLNPWAASSRSSSPAPPSNRSEPVVTAHGDHSTTHLYGQSIRTYPSDCPPLRVLWFHATDVSPSH